MHVTVCVLQPQEGRNHFNNWFSLLQLIVLQFVLVARPVFKTKGLRRFSAWAVNNLQIGGAVTRIILIVAHFCPDSDAERQSITNYKKGDGGKRT